jgi:hypothetical protein
MAKLVSPPTTLLIKSISPFTPLLEAAPVTAMAKEPKESSS